MKTDTVNIRLPRDLVAAYRKIVRGTGMSLNAAAAHGLRRALDTVALSAPSEDEAAVLATFRRAVARAAAVARPAAHAAPRPTAPVFAFPSIDLETTLDKGNFSLRTVNVLKTYCQAQGVRQETATLADLARVATERDLLRTYGFGRKSLNEVREVMIAAGLTLREET